MFVVIDQIFVTFSITCNTGGKHGCRRCMVKGVYDPARRHYYYQGFLRRSRFPAEERTPEKQFEDGLSCDNCLNENAKNKFSWTQESEVSQFCSSCINCTSLIPLRT